MSTSNPPAILKPVTGWGRVAATIEPHLDALIDLYVDGFSFRRAVEQLGIPVTAAQARSALMHHWPERWADAVAARAHELIERNGEHAISAAATGDASGLKAASEINFKLAAMYDPTRFGEKRTVELTGAGGGAIKTETMVTLSPDEAYKRMLGGEA